MSNDIKLEEGEEQEIGEGYHGTGQIREDLWIRCQHLWRPDRVRTKLRLKGNKDKGIKEYLFGCGWIFRVHGFG